MYCKIKNLIHKIRNWQQLFYTLRYYLLTTPKINTLQYTKNTVQSENVVAALGCPIILDFIIIFDKNNEMKNYFINGTRLRL